MAAYRTPLVVALTLVALLLVGAGCSKVEQKPPAAPDFDETPARQLARSVRAVAGINLVDQRIQWLETAAGRPDAAAIPFEEYERLAIEEATLYEAMTHAERHLVRSYAAKEAKSLAPELLERVASHVASVTSGAGFYLGPAPAEGETPRGGAYAEGFVLSLVRCCGGGGYAGLVLAPGGWACGAPEGVPFCQKPPAEVKAEAPTPAPAQ